MQKKIYIAGPMRGKEYYNFPHFRRIAFELRLNGWDVISPAEMDINLSNFDPYVLEHQDWDQVPDALDLKEVMRRDFEALMQVDAIYLLKGWEESVGARAEKALAEWLGLEIRYEVDPDPIKDILVEALEITGGDRQATYGPPDQDFRRTADMWTGLFQSLLSEGARFEPQHVAMAMILLKCSRQLHQKKRDNWVDIAGYSRCGNICDEVSKKAKQT